MSGNNSSTHVNYLILTLIASDLSAGFFGFFVAYFLRNEGFFRIFLESVQPLAVYLQVLPIALLLFFVTLMSVGLYDIRQRRTNFVEVYNCLRAVTFWVILIMSGSYLYKFDYSRVIVVLTYFFTAIFLIFGRQFVRFLQIKFFLRGFGRVNYAIVGSGIKAAEIDKKLRNSHILGFNFVGFLDSSDLRKKIKKFKIDEVYFADPSLSQEEILNQVSLCFDTGAKFKITTNIFGVLTENVDLANLENVPILDVSKTVFSIYQKLYKRFFDLLSSTIALIVTIPLFILIFIAIKLDSPGDPILGQKRVGKDGKIFKMYKFRTMRVDSTLYEKAPDRKNDKRVTRVGQFLRRTSLDELPQFVNVLKGEMSIVGPRPEMPFIVRGYEQWQKRRLMVKPGLTGLWQILGRKDLPLSENLEYDFYYINNQSILLDLVIVIKTIPMVLLGRGAY